ncbi:hypothetical protein DHEL01_v201228 [Diaporthe helianthi]|uniref:Uncharacterized protein n=1 Tax=Diaporthe helianthi TaxID=158607 RepID=A0A2P5ICY3_DIAHE|nr:hypothetical protein DHEL01_v201228 [Diaporthe helianthi]
MRIYLAELLAGPRATGREEAPGWEEASKLASWQAGKLSSKQASTAATKHGEDKAGGEPVSVGYLPANGCPNACQLDNVGTTRPINPPIHPYRPVVPGTRAEPRTSTPRPSKGTSNPFRLLPTRTPPPAARKPRNGSTPVQAITQPWGDGEEILILQGEGTIEHPDSST